IIGVDVGVLALEDVGRLLDSLLGSDQLVLPQADLPVGGTRRKALRIEIEISDDIAGEALSIRLVVDAERARVAESIAVSPEDAHTRRVKRAHPHRLGDRA